MAEYDSHANLCDIFARALLNEVPFDRIVWKTLDGNVWTAAALSQEIINRTDTGLQYISDVLRVSRDILARTANAKV